MEILDGKSYSSEIKQSVKEKSNHFVEHTKDHCLLALLLGMTKQVKFMSNQKKKHVKVALFYRA